MAKIVTADQGRGAGERYSQFMADDAIAFPTLDAADVAFLSALGTRRTVAAGELLFREGDVTYDFFVILSGAAEIVVGAGPREQTIVRHGPGRFLGELSLLTGQRVLVSARVTEPGEVIVVPAAALRQILATNPHLGDRILDAFIARRSQLLTGAATAIRLLGSPYSPESLHLREFLSRNRIPHQWIDADHDPEAEALILEYSIAPQDLPAVLVSREPLRRTTPGELAAYLGLTLDSIPERQFDLVVIGGGPAGLAAAVYGASEGLQTLLIERVAVGGQAGSSSRIENYLGFPTGISGGDLTMRALVQAEKFGAHMTSPCSAEALSECAGHLVVHLSDGTEVAARAVIVASGARYRRLDVARLEEFEGKGVYYAATELEARLCASDPVVVVGGGNSAGQAGLFLAGRGSRVTFAIRGTDLAANMSRYLVDRIELDSRIDVRTGTRVTDLGGDQFLAAVRLAGRDGDELLPSVALFSFIGADPESEWVSGCAQLDARGFVLTDRALDPEQLDSHWEILGRQPLPFETSRPGLFAVGDVRSGSTKRVAAAVGEGSAAVRSVHEYLAFSH
jgi:thioredoxin reductase (NADPH)